MILLKAANGVVGSRSGRCDRVGWLAGPWRLESSRNVNRSDATLNCELESQRAGAVIIRGMTYLRSPSSEYKWKERGGFCNSEGTSRVSTSWATPSPKGARYHSPGQRPGTSVRREMRALKGRPTFLAAGVDIRVTRGVTALQAL